jgi:hypothetical protein
LRQQLDRRSHPVHDVAIDLTGADESPGVSIRYVKSGEVGVHTEMRRAISCTPAEPA